MEPLRLFDDFEESIHLLTDLGLFAVGEINYAHSPILVIRALHYDTRDEWLYADQRGKDLGCGCPESDPS